MQKSSASSDIDAVTDAVLAASRVLLAVATRSLAETTSEVTLVQYRALVVLQSRGPQSAQGLAAELGIAPSTGTRLCDRLVAKDLVRRETAAGNRREVKLVVTPGGAAVVGRVSKRRRDELRKIVSSIPERDRSGLVRVLDAFSAAAGEVPDDDWYLGWA